MFLKSSSDHPGTLAIFQVRTAFTVHHTRRNVAAWSGQTHVGVAAISAELLQAAGLLNQ